MTITEFLAQCLDSEAPISRRVLEQVPEGRADWKPHEKSMPMGYLAQLVATQPAWIAMIVLQDSLDLNPPGGGGYKPPATNTLRELLAAADDSAKKAREALRSTNDQHMATNWQLLVGGRVPPLHRVRRRRPQLVGPRVRRSRAAEVAPGAAPHRPRH